MSLPTTNARLRIHAVVRFFEITLLYGHFFGATLFAANVLMRDVPALQGKFHAGLFALPVGLVAGLLILLFGAVLVFEFKAAGLPRAPEERPWQRRTRQALRLLIMSGIIVCFLTMVFFIALRFVDFRDEASESDWSLVALLSQALVSWLALMLVTLVHLDWLRRLQSTEVSAFATVPAMIQHVLPSPAVAHDLKTSVSRDSKLRIIQIWIGGLSCLLLGIEYVHGFFPQFASTTNLLAQFLVGFAFYLWISISATFFFLQSARREIGIVDGTYTAVGRSKLVTLYFALVFGAALLLALVCFGTNLYRTITILVLAQMSNFVFGLLLLAWGPLLFYAAVCMDVLLIHVRNTHEDQSVCSRVPVPLCMGTSYSIVTDNTLSYDQDFGN